MTDKSEYDYAERRRGSMTKKARFIEKNAALSPKEDCNEGCTKN
jgi:hypothetical protein